MVVSLYLLFYHGFIIIFDLVSALTCFDNISHLIAIFTIIFIICIDNKSQTKRPHLFETARDLFARQLSWLSFHWSWCFTPLLVLKRLPGFSYGFSVRVGWFPITSNSTSRRGFGFWKLRGKQSRCGNWKISGNFRILHFPYMKDYQRVSFNDSFQETSWILKETVLIWLGLPGKASSLHLPWAIPHHPATNTWDFSGALPFLGL